MYYAIDFGTSNSLLAAADATQTYAPISLDPTAPDPTVLRSILYFPTQKQVFYGSEALKEFKLNDLQGRLVRSAKKFLPQRWFIGTYIEDRPMNLEDLIGVFLKELRRRANEHFQKDVTQVVMGRPARFSEDDSDDQFAQYRLERAAKIAGFTEIHYLAEPIAAGYELHHSQGHEKIVLVCDFGGGTSDFTVMKGQEVLAIGGIPQAGDALDGSVMRRELLAYFGGDVEYKVPFGSNILKMPPHLMEKLCSPADIAILRKRDIIEFFKNVKSWSLTPVDRDKMERLFTVIEDNLGFDLFEAIERTKRALSGAAHATIDFEYPTISLNRPLSREGFEICIEEPTTKILTTLDETLKRAQISAEQVDVVFCTGGTAKVPLLNRELTTRFGAAKIQERNHFHSVVQGLALHAKSLQQ